MNISTDDGAHVGRVDMTSGPPASSVDAAVVRPVPLRRGTRSAGGTGRPACVGSSSPTARWTPPTARPASSSSPTSVPTTILDVSLGTNADYDNNRIYVAFIESNNAVRCYWDVASDGTTFTEVSPAGVSAASGLDSHWGDGTMGSPLVLLWFSYLGTDGSIHVLGRAAFARVWTYDTISPDLSSSTSTRISAHGNNVVVAYTAQRTNATCCGIPRQLRQRTDMEFGRTVRPTGRRARLQRRRHHGTRRVGLGGGLER